MSRQGGTHHHGPLAGLGAGAAAVLTGGGVILIAARRQLDEVATVIYAVLWLRHRVRHPETLAGRQIIRAEAVDQAAVPQAVGTPRPAAIEPPRVYLNVTRDQLAAILRHSIEEK